MSAPLGVTPGALTGRVLLAALNSRIITDGTPWPEAVVARWPLVALDRTILAAGIPWPRLAEAAACGA